MARAESVRSLFAYLHASPSPYHAVANAVTRLEEAGFRRLDEREPWPDVSGGRFVARAGALVAWRSPSDAAPTAGFRIVGAHTDSPNLRIKPHPDTGSVGWAAGTRELRYDIDRLPLSDGRFHLRLGLADRDGELLHWLDDALGFLVYPAGEERGGVVRGMVVGPDEDGVSAWRGATSDPPTDLGGDPVGFIGA